MKDYHVHALGGLVNLNTLSPKQDYFYRIRHPDEVAMGVFVADLAFFDMGGHLIYCCPKNAPAAYLPPFKTLEFVVWLDNGQFAFFIEYIRNNTLYCMLDLEEGACFKKKPDETFLEDFIDNIKSMTSHNREILESLGFYEFKTDATYLKKNYRKGVFRRWKP